jgi:hypothetical protein
MLSILPKFVCTKIIKEQKRRTAKMRRTNRFSVRASMRARFFHSFRRNQVAPLPPEGYYASNFQTSRRGHLENRGGHASQRRFHADLGPSRPAA